MAAENTELALQKISDVVSNSQGGVYKRIDENRELIELLLQEAPGLLDKFPWISGWLESQDNFLCDVLEVVPVKKTMTSKKEGFPRVMPSRKRKQVH